jgi:proton glutamate symport protein
MARNRCAACRCRCRTDKERRVQLYTKIFIGLVAGIGTGMIANLLDLIWLQDLLRRIEPLGTVFIRLIMMIVIPLIVASLILGTASLGDIRKLGRLGGKTVAFYLFTTAAAVAMGLLVSNIVRPGARIDPATRDSIAAAFDVDAAGRVALAGERPALSETLLNMVPSNPFRSAADGELLPLIIFSIIFGAALSLVVRERREAVLLFFNGVNDAVMVIIDWIMRLAPYAVFALVGAIVSRFGMDLLRSLLVYTLVVVSGLVLHLLITYMSILRFVGGMNPLVFARRILEAPLVAFSTSSSSATLPVTMEVAREKLGVSHETSSFVLPLGATINMDGTALYQAVAVMFIAQIYGIPLGVTEQLTIVLTATLASVGAAGVPSAGIVTLIMVLNSVGLGAHTQTGIALILGVDRILDMLRTAVNVTGDLTASVVIARTEGEELVPRPVTHPIAIGPRN